MKTKLLPGSKVLVFDPFLFKNDKLTPLSITVQPAIIVCRYGKKTRFGKYLDLVDVIFDHRPNDISHGHFTDGVKRVD